MTEESDTTIKRLLEILEHDRRHVMLYVGICFAVPTFKLGQLKPNPSQLAERILLLTSLTLFVLAGVNFYLYAQRIHWKRFEGISSIMDGDAQSLREVLFGKNGIWATAKHFFIIGRTLLVAAAVIYVLFMAAYILS